MNPAVGEGKDAALEKAVLGEGQQHQMGREDDGGTFDQSELM